MRIRITRHLLVGLLLGGVAGSIVGLVLEFAFDHGGTEFAIAWVAWVLFGSGIGTLVGGYSSLESPQPGNEPSEVERPIRDRPDLTVTEHDESRAQDEDHRRQA
jgi:gas vesicle protein